MHRLTFDNQIESISSGREMKGHDLLDSRRYIGSLSANDEFSSDELRRFLMNSRDIQESQICGSEEFPGKFLKPSSENVLISTISDKMIDLIVDYYAATYSNLAFRKPFDDTLSNAITIRVKMNQYGRCRIGSEVFGSTMSLRHIKSSYILAKFIVDDENVDIYPGQVQHYFTHTVDLPNGPTEHFLAYVRWYKPVNSSNIRYRFSIDEICNVELWSTEFYPESRDCIIPIHHILGRFVPVKYQISNRRNTREYMAVNPVNRKFHI
jgi:hypothetical protein